MASVTQRFLIAFKFIDCHRFKIIKLAPVNKPNNYSFVSYLQRVNSTANVLSKIPITTDKAILYTLSQ